MYTPPKFNSSPLKNDGKGRLYPFLLGPGTVTFQGQTRSSLPRSKEPMAARLWQKKIRSMSSRRVKRPNGEGCSHRFPRRTWVQEAPNRNFEDCKLPVWSHGSNICETCDVFLKYSASGVDKSNLRDDPSMNVRERRKKMCHVNVRAKAG